MAFIMIASRNRQNKSIRYKRDVVSKTSKDTKTEESISQRRSAWRLSRHLFKIVFWNPKNHLNALLSFLSATSSPNGKRKREKEWESEMEKGTCKTQLSALNDQKLPVRIFLYKLHNEPKAKTVLSSKKSSNNSNRGKSSLFLENFQIIKNSIFLDSICRVNLKKKKKRR